MRLFMVDFDGMTDNRPIGVMDSGIGGLTVFKALKAALPQESFIYVGDTARIPYGSRNEAVIEHFSEELAAFLLRQNVKAVVVACNTISATALPMVRARAGAVPVFDVISPVVQKVRALKAPVLGVLATHRTVQQKSYSAALNGHKVIEAACPLLVPFVEEGVIKGPAIEELIREYVAALKAKNVRLVVLGCTHYPILAPLIQKALGEHVKIIDSAEPLAEALKVAIKKGIVPPAPKGKGRTIFFFTDTPLRSQKVAEQFFGAALSDLRPLNLQSVERVRPVAGLAVHDRYWQGNKTPCLILHGWGSWSDSWLDISQRLHEQGHAVYALDLPGFGGSAEPAAVWGTAAYAQFLQNYATSLGLKKFCLIGHSFGGQVALWFARHYPKALKAMVLIAAAGLRHEPTPKEKLVTAAAKVGRPMAGILRRAGLEKFALKLLGRLSGSYDYANASPQMRLVLKKVIREDAQEFLADLKTPALILWAADDPITPIKDAETMAAALPRASLKIFASGGHSFYKLAGQEVTAAITAFLHD